MFFTFQGLVRVDLRSLQQSGGLLGGLYNVIYSFTEDAQPRLNWRLELLPWLVHMFFVQRMDRFAGNFTGNHGLPLKYGGFCCIFVPLTNPRTRMFAKLLPLAHGSVGWWKTTEKKDRSMTQKCIEILDVETILFYNHGSGFFWRVSSHFNQKESYT